MPLPANGTLSLQGHSKPGDALPSKPKQAMIVRMSAETLDALEAFPNQPPMEFAFGKNPGIYIGETFFPMRSQKEDSPHELYLRSSSAAKPMAPLKLYANVTGKFMVERELGEKIQDKVRDRTQVAEKQRTERKVQMLDSPLDLPRANGKKRKAPSASSSLLKQAAHNDHLRNISSTPSRVASPLPPSTQSSTPTTTKDRRLMIQYLAISPRSTDEVMRAIGGADCDSATRRTLFEYLDEVAELDTSQKKGDKSPRPWVLKTATWLEVRPFQWKLAEKEQLTIARNARMALKTLRIPESDPAWDNVTYRSTTTPSSSAAGANSSKGTTPNATPGGSSSSSKPEAKRGVMSKDVKEKKVKVKTEAQKQKTEVYMKDEGAKASKAAAASAKAKEPAESLASRSSASHSQTPVRRHPGSAPKAVKPSSAQDGVETPTRPSTPGDARSTPKDSQSKPPSTASTQHTHERKPSATSTMRISKTTIPATKDKDKFKDKADEKHTLPVTTTAATSTSVKRKKPTREEPEPDDDALRKTNLQKKRKTDDGALSVSASSTSSKDPRARDLKKASMDITPAARPKTVVAAAPSPLSSATRPSQTSAPLVPSSSSSSKPRVQSDKDRPPKANGTSKPRRRSPIYTSSEDEGEIPQSQSQSQSQSQPHHQNPHQNPRQNPHPHAHRSDFPPSSSLLPDFISNPRPRPPLPPAWDHVALRKRYSSSYQEYIAVFSLIIAQKSQIESMLKSDSDMEGGGDGGGGDGVELLETKELARVASQHHSLKDELESIKSIFLTGKLPGEASPRSD